MGITYTLGIVAESSMDEDEPSRQAELKRCRHGDAIILRRDPGNLHDRYAIICSSARGAIIGMISRDNAEWLAGVMNEGRTVDAAIKEIYRRIGTEDLGVIIYCHIDGGDEERKKPKGRFERLWLKVKGSIPSST